jgi:uncharacterized protein
VYSLIWKFKYQLAVLASFLFVFCAYNLFNANLYFDSERIINEFEQSTMDVKVLDDNNLVFLGFSFSDSLQYADFKDANEFHKTLKKSDYIKRVFSLVNDRKLVDMGLFPMAKKVLNLSSVEAYEKSVKNIEQNQNNFISSDFKNLMFLIESKGDLDIEQTTAFIAYMKSLRVNSNCQEVFVAGRAPSEIYLKDKIIKEFLLITLISATLCFFFLLLVTKNIKQVLLTVFSVLASIVVTLGMSQLLFDGIELVMIITPAILFIVCISDIMHFTNKQDDSGKTKEEFFLSRMNRVGRAVALTSVTTALSFLTFLVNDILPILRFGLITSFGVLFTLFFAIIIYAICIDKQIHRAQPIDFLHNATESLLVFFKKCRTSTAFHFITAGFIALGVYGVANVQVDNYLTDEINKKSPLFQQTSFFDSYFGGIKPITVLLNKSEVDDLDVLDNITEDLKSNGFVVDFTNVSLSGAGLQKMGFTPDDFKDNYFYICRTTDEGSLATLKKLRSLESKYASQGLVMEFSGAGYLFDILGNDLTKKLIYGLLIAILSIGFIFFFINKFDYRYFFIALIPNIVPILVCVGILHCFDFYFSLSNAFIFTIVFGLIIDDSIHVISAYSNHMKRNVPVNEALDSVVNLTGVAVIKTTFIVLICLLPLAFSEFKSVSQLSVITITSAVIAVFFDLIYLPLILKKLAK